MTTELDRIRLHIVDKVRALRRARRLTQAELAGKLGLSQARLSEIESGDGSFTAEQLVVILRLFNVGLSDVRRQPHLAATDAAGARPAHRHASPAEDQLAVDGAAAPGDAGVLRPAQPDAILLEHRLHDRSWYRRGG
jgi:transcriptional regulator with XRE-family HTH domain